jgi:hypothetical protein
MKTRWFGKHRSPRHRPLVRGFDLGGGRRFLGRFDEEALRRELEGEGILVGLAARGYEDLVLRRSLEGGEHRLRIRARGGRKSLVDLRLAETTLVVSEPVLRGEGLEVLSVLFNTWLSLQDPNARFTLDRPPLPGQQWPGLGLARAFYSLMARWASEWGKDAVLATPEHFHNAVFYSRAFHFLSPAEQGRFAALRRDLAPLSVAAASASVNEGRVRDLVTQRPFEWRPGAMAAPVGAPVARAFESDAYRRGAEAARESARFGLAAS